MQPASWKRTLFKSLRIFAQCPSNNDTGQSSCSQANRLTGSIQLLVEEKLYGLVNEDDDDQKENTHTHTLTIGELSHCEQILTGVEGSGWFDTITDAGRVCIQHQSNLHSSNVDVETTHDSKRLVGYLIQAL